jgi:acetyl esterase/lipase
MNDANNGQLARSSKVAIVSVDYRLAPEHPYPAGPDDCEAAALWLLENAERELGSSRLLISGDSAGAHLAAVTLLRIRDRHGAIARFEGANLVFGCFDLSGTPSQRDPRHTPVLSASDIEQMPAHFLPGLSLEERRVPDISPLYADLSGLPPALFTCGTGDRLLDDTLFMAARWQAAGSRAELALYPEAPHGFTMFPIAMARAANERIARFVGGIVGGAAA